MQRALTEHEATESVNLLFDQIMGDGGKEHIQALIVDQDRAKRVIRLDWTSQPLPASMPTFFREFLVALEKAQGHEEYHGNLVSDGRTEGAVESTADGDSDEKENELGGESFDPNLLVFPATTVNIRNGVELSEILNGLEGAFGKGIMVFMQPGVLERLLMGVAWMKLITPLLLEVMPCFKDVCKLAEDKILKNIMAYEDIQRGKFEGILKTVKDVLDAVELQADDVDREDEETTMMQPLDEE
ncbi:hypothetical protein B0J14DRAFT_646627 [Halenospora varia]|nr:hypothetical protein B0J14DRAFT_646627 [Halenospora varia]